MMAVINIKVSYLLVVIRYVNVLLKQNKPESNIKTDYVTIQTHFVAVLWGPNQRQVYMKQQKIVWLKLFSCF